MAVESGKFTPQVTWVRYQTFSGCKIDGHVAVPKPEGVRHLDRAYYLTAMLEAPHYGAVQSYDGCAMSGGSLHNVAVLPQSMSQGSLFALLASMERAQPTALSMLQLLAAYREQGWVVSGEGELWQVGAQTRVRGVEIREAFTPPQGVVPRTGASWERAKRWALLHSAVFRDPLLFDAQKEYALEWLLDSHRATEDLFYRGKNVKTLAVGTEISPEEDLALCVYHVYSVNGPRPARDILLETQKQPLKPKDFARTLIGKFAQSTYGNWPVRYARTRAVAQSTGFWPAAFFTGQKALFPLRK